VICPCCGATQPKMNPMRFPMPPDLVLTWNQLHFVEKKLMAALYLDHLRQPYRDWRALLLADHARMRYRQVHNALRRLKACGWVQHVSRGVYRITDNALGRMAWLPPKLTQMKIVNKVEPVAATDPAQDPAQETP
jgi:hypothetical protein